MPFFYYATKLDYFQNLIMKIIKIHNEKFRITYIMHYASFVDAKKLVLIVERFIFSAKT